MHSSQVRVEKIKHFYECTQNLFESEFCLGQFNPKIFKQRFFEVKVILLYKTSTPLICTNCIVVHYSKNVTVLLSEVVCCDVVWSISLAWSWQMSGSEIMDESLINPYNGTINEQSQKHSEPLLRYSCATLVSKVGLRLVVCFRNYASSLMKIITLRFERWLISF